LIAGEPSRTAFHVAACRAAHLRFDPPPHLLEDRIAERLIGEGAEELIASYGQGASWVLLENRLFMPFRARFAEDCVADAHRAGVRQLVVLGAGLDSFAWRRPAGLAGLQVYEVDHPATQNWKRERLREIGLGVPDHLSFAACDFETTPIAAALARTGFRSAEPAIVTWMGVVYYLSQISVDRTLAELAALLAPGSAVVLDYQLPLDSLSRRYRELATRLNSYLAGVGEPQVSRHRPEELRQALLAAGFERAEIAPRDELERRYFAPLASAIPLAERFGIAVARREPA